MKARTSIYVATLGLYLAGGVALTMAQTSSARYTVDQRALDELRRAITNLNLPDTANPAASPAAESATQTQDQDTREQAILKLRETLATLPDPELPRAAAASAKSPPVLVDESTLEILRRATAELALAEQTNRATTPSETPTNSSLDARDRAVIKLRETLAALPDPDAPAVPAASEAPTPVLVDESTLEILRRAMADQEAARAGQDQGTAKSTTLPIIDDRNTPIQPLESTRRTSPTASSANRPKTTPASQPKLTVDLLGGNQSPAALAADSTTFQRSMEGNTAASRETTPRAASRTATGAATSNSEPTIDEDTYRRLLSNSPEPAVGRAGTVAGQGTPRAAASRSSIRRDQNHPLVPQDKLSYLILEDPDKNLGPMILSVTSQNYIDFPVSMNPEFKATVIEVNTNGKTLGQIQAEVTRELEKYYYHDATVVLKLYDSTQVLGKALFYGYVKGQVELTPGKPTTLTDALTSLHYDDWADLKRVTLHRENPATGETRTIEINVKEMMESGDFSNDPILQDGDKIEVPEKRIRF